MKARKWKRLFLVSTATLSLAVILWAAYLFTAIWLRVRSARELAEQAQPLSEILLNEDEPGMGVNDSDEMITFTGLTGIFEVRTHNSLQRLESLQRPSVGTVLRHLMGKGGGEETADIQKVQTIAVSPQGQVLATGGSTTSTVQIWNAQTSAPQSSSFSVNITTSSAPGNSTLAFRKVLLWRPDLDYQCHSATDAHGETVLLVTRPIPQEPVDAPATELSPPDRELLLIDSAGRIFARLRCPGGGLVGKLTQPHGKADQLVFGTRAYVSHQTGVFRPRLVGLGAVCFIEDGQLKVVRSIPALEASNSEPSPDESPDYP